MSRSSVFSAMALPAMAFPAIEMAGCTCETRLRGFGVVSPRRGTSYVQTAISMAGLHPSYVHTAISMAGKGEPCFDKRP